MLLLIDGYNVVAPVAGPRDGGRQRVAPDWLHRERMLLMRRMAKHLPENIREKTCVVFDAVHPPKDRPSEYQFEGITIRFSVGYAEADDLIEEIISQHPTPKKLTVVSSDRRLQTSAKRRRCVTFDSQSWLDDLLGGKLEIQNLSKRQQESDPAIEKELGMKEIVAPTDVDQWMRDFGFDQ